MTTQLSNHAGDSPAASTDTNAKETRRQQSPWPAVEVSKLREALTEAAKAAKPSSPAIDFGRYVRRDVDLAPDSAAGVLAMGKFLRLDPVGKAIERHDNAIQELRSENLAIRRQQRSARPRRTNGGRGVKKDTDYLLYELVKSVVEDLKAEGYSKQEQEAQLIERVYALAADDLAKEISKRLGKKKGGVISGRKIRRGETNWKKLPNGRRKKIGVTYFSKLYEKWKVHRIGGGIESELTGCSAEEAEGGEDTREANLAGGDTKGATKREAALDEVRSGKMTAHAGGTGVFRKRKAKTVIEEKEDQAERDADELLRSAGLAPTNVRG